MKNKWLILVAALIMLAITWWDADFSVYRDLSAGDILPVLVITAVIFLIKTGALSAILVLLKKLWERLRRK